MLLEFAITSFVHYSLSLLQLVFAHDEAVVLERKAQAENSSFPASIFSFKDNEVESAEEVARRIETAAERLGTERIQYVHPDCGFWMFILKNLYFILHSMYTLCLITIATYF